MPKPLRGEWQALQDAVQGRQIQGAESSVRRMAVVAGELRLLAQRSAEAARESKGLIQVSVERVEQGSHQVQDAGRTRRQLVQAMSVFKVR